MVEDNCKVGEKLQRITGMNLKSPQTKGLHKKIDTQPEDSPLVKHMSKLKALVQGDKT